MLYNDYGRSVVKGKIFMEIELKLDTFKTLNSRSSTKVLEYLGLIGGLAGAV